MNDSTFKKVCEIRKGDIVRSVNRKGVKDNAKVLCVIETKIKNGICKLCNINGLLVTPWHPIKF